MHFAFEPVAAWPPLAWLALCSPGSDRVVVRHGPSVGCAPAWFCEAIWDGPFTEGDFDRTDRVFGSGGRLRREGVVFVSSATTVDRLCSFEREGTIAVSNSLACLAAALSLALDPADTAAAEALARVTDGLRDPRRRLESLSGPVRLTVHDNLLWDGNALAPRPKPDPPRDFSSFERYRAFLAESLAALCENLRAPARPRPLELLSTASSGYDSSAVTVLAAEAGLREVVTVDRSRYGRDDSGLFLIEHLGLTPVRVERRPGRVPPFTDVPFVVGDGVGRDVFLAGAEDRLAGRALLSGYHGDAVWGPGWSGAPPADRDLRRPMGRPAGLSLTEYRLWVGFIHCPLPYLGARDVAQLRALSASDEMRPWRRGGAYDRPLPRRILEEAGVPGSSFGTSKKVAGLLASYRPDLEALRERDPEADADLRAWLSAHAHCWWRRGRLPPLWGDALEAALVRAVRALWALLGPWLEPSEPARRHRLHVLLARLPAARVSRHRLPWALSRAAERYARAPAGRASVSAGGVGPGIDGPEE